MIRKAILSLILFLVIDGIYGQDNIVPNGDFEVFHAPDEWSYTSADFNKLFDNWYSPTSTSPDLFGPNTLLPPKWKSAGFGDIGPISGDYFVGFTLYGCDRGKPHCREYLATPLKSFSNQTNRFALEIHIGIMSGTKQIKQMNLYFSENPFSEQTFGVIPGINPDIEFSLPLMKSNTWYVVKDTFSMDPVKMKYVTIGNFLRDIATPTYPAQSKYPFSYYYIDDIKITPILDSNSIQIKDIPTIDPIIVSNEKDWFPLRVGKTIILRNVYFDFDKYDILPKSDNELRRLLGIMRDYPEMKIQINGHTDDWGTNEYNIQLSRNRAKAITDYLIANGIEPSRLQFDGYGEEKPMDTNDTEAGRAKNRRVEFTILSM